MGIRSLERQVMRNKCYLANGNVKGFEDAWKKHKATPLSSVAADSPKVYRRRGKRKQRHYDDKNLIVHSLWGMKDWINKRKAEKQKETTVAI